MNERKLRWGILGTAKIASKSVIPGLKRGNLCDVRAIASRTEDKAKTVANQFALPKYYSTYEQLLDDPEIEAIYIPLPNHLHVEWSRKALEAGKHVLCEKPLALHTEEVQELIKLRDETKLKIGEAFMVHTHPQWLRAKSMVQNPKFGGLQSIQGFFSYNNRDPENVRNKYSEGGGGLWDIGCYPVHTSRFMFDEEPERVIAGFIYDPKFKVDKMVSAILQFPTGQAAFTCSTQIVPWQTMQFFGEKQRVEIEIPFNQPGDFPARLLIDDGSDVTGVPEEIVIPPADQYAIQGDEFARAVIENTEVPVPLENTLYNTAVIRALFRSGESGTWETPQV